VEAACQAFTLRVLTLGSCSEPDPNRLQAYRSWRKIVGCGLRLVGDEEDDLIKSVSMSEGQEYQRTLRVIHQLKWAKAGRLQGNAGNRRAALPISPTASAALPSAVPACPAPSDTLQPDSSCLVTVC